MRSQLSKSGLHLGFEDIADNFNLRSRALTLFFSPVNPTYAAVFLGESEDDIMQARAYQLEELEHDACFTLLAAVEAAFRLDYALRNERRLKRTKPLTRLLRELYDKYELRASLESGILQAWFDAVPECKPLISALRGAFSYRHWLAHGRYWTPKFGREYDFDTLFTLASKVQSLELLQP